VVAAAGTKFYHDHLIGQSQVLAFWKDESMDALNKDELTSRNNDEQGEVAKKRMAKLTERMRHRSRRYQWEAYILMIAAISIGVGAVLLFVKAPSSGTTVNFNGISTVQSLQFPPTTWEDLAKEAILRLGSVIVAIFLVQILVAFGRYRLRLAEFIDWRADILDIAQDDLSKVKQLVAVFGLTTVEFVAFPESPIERIAAALGPNVRRATRTAKPAGGAAKSPASG